MSYKKTYQDPRWQKKRLKILERDKWCCQKCFDDESTLHVHHRYYLTDKEPWDYPDETLITLCEECHQEEIETRKQHENTLLFTLKKKFFCEDILNLAIAFEFMPLLHQPEVVVSMIEWALTTHEVQKELIERFFAETHKKRQAAEKINV